MLLQELNTQWRRYVVPARDEATYESRRRYSRADLAKITGYAENILVYWADRHRTRTHAPALGRVERRDLSTALDLRHLP